MKLEAVIVCKDYADFLACTIQSVKTQTDRLVVVTSREDRQTRSLCEFWHVECVQADCVSADRFDKGAAIREGLKKLDADGWVCQVDADMWWPPRTRELIDRAEASWGLDPACLYGVDRLMCGCYEDWQAYLAQPRCIHDQQIFIQARFPVGTRVGKLYDDGYYPLGFFQMWCPSTSGVADYPSNEGADHSDVAMARRWPRARRVLLPEIYMVHLASETGGKMGINWNGRQTRLFGPPPIRHTSTPLEIDADGIPTLEEVDHPPIVLRSRASAKLIEEWKEGKRTTNSTRAALAKLDDDLRDILRRGEAAMKRHKPEPNPYGGCLPVWLRDLAAWLRRLRGR